jgi:guanylate kinase
MALSESLRRRAAAVEKQPNYLGPDLSDKIVIGIEGPFGAGKSTLTDQCITMLRDAGHDVGIIGTNTTRESRPNDPDHYVSEIDPETLIKRGENGELINLNMFATGQLYATDANSIPHAINIGPLLPAAIDKFKQAGCKAVFAFYLTLTPEQWQKQLDKEQRLSRPDVARRLEEAVESLENALYAAEHPSHHQQFIVNNDGSQSIEQLAGRILYMAGFKGFDDYRHYTGNQLNELYNYALFLQNDIKAA